MKHINRLVAQAGEDALVGLLDLYGRYAADGPPRRAALGAEHLGPWLPNLCIVEMVGDRFRFRLCGTRAAELLGRDMTGLEACDAHAPQGEVAYREAVATGEPVLHRYDVHGDDGTRRVTELALPVAGATGPELLVAVYGRAAQRGAA